MTEPSLQNNMPRPASGPCLVPAHAEKGQAVIPLDRPIMLIGSAAGAHILLSGEGISAAHALLINSANRFYIRDLASRTHVIVNGTRVREHLLATGDVLQIGPRSFRFFCPPGWQVNAPVPAAVAKLQIGEAPEPLPIASRVVVMGRPAGCDIVLAAGGEDEVHAAIVERDGARWICELSASGGVLVNGVPVRQVELHGNDLIRVGGMEIRYLPKVAEARPKIIPPKHSGFFNLEEGPMLSLGGMPLHLQEVAPPPGSFGKVQIVFHEKTSEPVVPPPTFAKAADIAEVERDEEEDEGLADAAAERKTDQPPAGEGSKLLESRWDSTRRIKPPPPARNVVPHSVTRYNETDDSLDFDTNQIFIDEIPPVEGSDMVFPSGATPTSGFDRMEVTSVREADVFSEVFTPQSDLEWANEKVAEKEAPIPTVDSAIHYPDALWGTMEGGTPATPAVAMEKPSGLEEWIESTMSLDSAMRDPFAMGDPSSIVRGLLGEATSNPETAADRLPPVSPAVQPETPARGSRIPGVPVLVGIMLGLALAAGAIIYNLMPPSSVIEGVLVLKNISLQSPGNRKTIEAAQKDMLATDEFRHRVIATLKQQHPELDAGFLKDSVQFLKAMDYSSWPANRKDTFVIHFETTDAVNDQARLYAVLVELFNARGYLVSRARETRRDAVEMEKAIAQAQRRCEAMKTEIARVQKLAESRPTVQEIQKLEAEEAGRKTRWQAAAEATKSLESDLQAIQARIGQSPPSPELEQSRSQKQLELAAARIKETSLRKDHEEARKNLQTAQATAEAARTAGQKLDNYRNQLIALEYQIISAREDLDLRQREVSQLLEPISPDAKQDVRVVAVFDPRRTYFLIACGMLLTAFGVLVFLRMRDLREAEDDSTTAKSAALSTPE